MSFICNQLVFNSIKISVYGLLTKDQAESPNHNQEKVQAKTEMPVATAAATAIPLQTCAPLVLCSCESVYDK
jgi:hypothetical protein